MIGISWNGFHLTIWWKLSFTILALGLFGGIFRSLWLLIISLSIVYTCSSFKKNDFLHSMYALYDVIVIKLRFLAYKVFLINTFFFNTKTICQRLKNKTICSFYRNYIANLPALVAVFFKETEKSLRITFYWEKKCSYFM